MLGRRKGTARSFEHADDCRIKRADPAVEIPWSYIGDGLWKAECVCSAETYREPISRSVRSDPLDPTTSRHAGQCEFVNTTDVAVLRLALKVKDSDGYWWVECVSCAHGWQVPYYAERVG